MKITDKMDRSRAVEIGDFTIMPCVDYPDGTKSVWIEEETGEGAQFPATALEEVIRKFYDANF